MLRKISQYILDHVIVVKGEGNQLEKIRLELKNHLSDWNRLHKTITNNRIRIFIFIFYASLGEGQSTKNATGIVGRKTVSER